MKENGVRGIATFVWCINNKLTCGIYSSVPNRRIGPNKRAGGKILKKH